jgi:hypothetical protein
MKYRQPSGVTTVRLREVSAKTGNKVSDGSEGLYKLRGEK